MITLFTFHKNIFHFFIIIYIKIISDLIGLFDDTIKHKTID